MNVLKTVFSFLLLQTGFVLFAQDNFYEKLSDAAISLTETLVIYDPSYFNINYPNGDIPKIKGVCTDVIIRAYRKVGIDLQKEVHEDMKDNFGLYPKNWGLKSTDKNIDHRRVPNLMTFFERKGEIKEITKNHEDYLPGDIVCWNLERNVLHIGIVVDKKSLFSNRYAVVHNIGMGQVVEDCLFDFKIIGHYRYKK